VTVDANELSCMKACVEQIDRRAQAGANFTGTEATPEVLVLSSSLLTDRMFLYTNFLNRLNKDCNIKLWAMSAHTPRFQQVWNESPAHVEEFPAIRAFKEIPHNYLRRLNEFVWDFRQQPPSRLSMTRHMRNKQQRKHISFLKVPARVLALARTEQFLENRLEKLLLAYTRSHAASERLRVARPTSVLATGPFQFEQPAIVAASKNLRIPTLALIPSWDNLSTKNRMVFKYDGYLVWSEQSKRELHYFYPNTIRLPVYVIGAPQFDVFFQPRFRQTREEFCATQELKPELPVIVYAVGSPNFLQEHHEAVALAERVARGELGDVQMIVRPHPIHDQGQMKELFARYAPRVILQQTSEATTPLNARSQDVSQIVEWVNTFRHADVVVNLSSTVTVDASIFDRPVVNLDYDPEPGQPNQELVKDVNHVWTHFKPIAESGGVWLVNNTNELVEAVKTYLKRPELHREKRRWIAEYVCGYLDGRCGERMAEAILDFNRLHTKTPNRE